jgi:signal peptidase I
MTATDQSPNKREARRSMKFLSIAGVIVILVVVSVGTATLQYKLKDVRTFRDPSSSMCPTICENERFLAAMNAYSVNPPARGDVILFAHHLGDTSTLLVKRVVGIEGDVVSAPSGTIFVNGKPSPDAQAKPPCGSPVLGPRPSEELPHFDAVKVQPGSLFVVGDNLTNSFDSRYPQFGQVSIADVRGRPFYIYWSAESSRLACAVR